MISKKTGQDYFTRDGGKVITHKNVGSEVRLSPSGQFRKAMAKKINKGTKINIKHK